MNTRTPNRTKFSAMFRSRRATVRRRLGLAQTHAEDGAALIEFALSMVIFFAVAFGAIALSLAAYTYFFVSNAAREASRYAMVRGLSLGTDCTSPGYANCIAQYGASGDITTYIQNLGFPGITSSNITVATKWYTSAGVFCGTNDPCKTQGNIVQVKVSYPYPLKIPFGPNRTLTLSSTSQMVISH